MLHREGASVLTADHVPALVHDDRWAKVWDLSKTATLGPWRGLFRGPIHRGGVKGVMVVMAALVERVDPELWTACKGRLPGRVHLG